MQVNNGHSGAPRPSALRPTRSSTAAGSLPAAAGAESSERTTASPTLLTALADSPEVRSERLAEVRQRLASGFYGTREAAEATAAVLTGSSSHQEEAS